MKKLVLKPRETETGLCMCLPTWADYLVVYETRAEIALGVQSHTANYRTGFFNEYYEDTLE